MKAQVDSRAAAAKRLHKNLAEVEKLRSKTGRLESQIYRDTFEWIQQTMSRQGVEDIHRAFDAFRSTFKVSLATARRYYDLGSFMEKEALEPDTVDSPTVSALKKALPRLGRAAKLRVKEEIKTCDPVKIRTAIQREVRNAIEDKPSTHTVAGKPMLLEGARLLDAAREVFPGNSIQVIVICNETEVFRCGDKN